MKSFLTSIYYFWYCNYNTKHIYLIVKEKETNMEEDKAHMYKFYEYKAQLNNVIKELRQVKPDRKISLTITKIEEACHWLNDYIKSE